MDLGSAQDVTLRNARELAAKWRNLAAAEVDPIKQREKERREALRNLHSLKDIAEDAFESRKAELKGDGEAGRWYSPLKLYIIPKLGKVPVAVIDQTDIRDTLAPIWHTKTYWPNWARIKPLCHWQAIRSTPTNSLGWR